MAWTANSLTLNAMYTKMRNDLEAIAYETSEFFIVYDAGVYACCTSDMDRVNNVVSTLKSAAVYEVSRQTSTRIF